MDTGQDLYHRLNEGMKYERFHAFETNLEKNLPFINKHGGIRGIPSRLSGKHVIIAGAGASLATGMGYLKKFWQRRELVIIAVDMALKPLVDQGIYPDYVISCETTPVDYFSEVQTEKMHLLAFSCIYNGHLRNWDGPVSFYNWQMEGDDYRRLWDRAGHDLGFVATGSIVTTQAAAIALGGAPASLLLMGNDLAFKDRFYGPGTCREAALRNGTTRFLPGEAREYDSLRRAREFEIHRDGQKYYTNSQFLAAKSWLEELFRGISLPVYDISEPGCSGAVVVKTSPGEYFSQFQQKRRRKR